MATRVLDATLVLCLLTTTICVSTVSSKTLECRKLGPCSCEMSDGSGVIDLSTLGNAGSEPTQVDARYKDVRAKDAATYSFNPCWAFEQVGCHGVSVCQRIPDRRFSIFFTLGHHHTAEFLHNGSHVILKYKGKTGTSQVIRTSWITLLCNNENQDTIFIPYGEDPYIKPLHYYFEFKTPCACPGRCQKDPPPPKEEVQKVEINVEEKKEHNNDKPKMEERNDIPQKENNHEKQGENKVEIHDKDDTDNKV